MKPESEYTVGEFMTKDLVEVGPGTTIQSCAEIMAIQKVSSAIIAENNSLLGIITEKDLARKIVAKGLNASEVLVQDIMTRDVITMDPDASLYDAIVLLNAKKIKHLPVVKDNVVLGLITSMDILRVQPACMELLASKAEQNTEE